MLRENNLEQKYKKIKGSLLKKKETEYLNPVSSKKQILFQLFFAKSYLFNI